MLAQLSQYFTDYQQWSLLLLRLVVALTLLVHGLPKLANLRRTAANFTMMGFWPGAFWGTVVAVVEGIGGVAILVGFWTSFAAALFAIQMFVGAIWKMHRGQGFAGGYELDLILMAAALVLVTFGSGPTSLDAYWW